MNCRAFQNLFSIAIVTAVMWQAMPIVVVQAEDDVVIGMSTALSGPTARLGLDMRAGVNAAFQEINNQGGVNGRMVRLIALDDAYEPRNCRNNMVQLIGNENVMAIIGNVGTPTAVVAVPLANEHRIPFVAPFTGASLLRKSPPDRYVVNYRASYAEETAAMVKGLVQAGIKPSEIAFFTQDDSYGDDGYYGGLAAIQSIRPEITQIEIAHGRYERNSQAVESALADLLVHSPTPKAVIMIGAYAPCAEFIRLSKANGFEPRFLNVSFVGVDPLLKALGTLSEGVVVTQVVPHYEGNTPIALEYRQAMQKFQPDEQLSFGSLEGYIAGRLLLRSMQSIEGRLTREKIVEAFDQMGDFDLGLGVPLHLSCNDHQASNMVWPTIIRDQKILPMNWSDGDDQ
ncbi:ABC transporter substrate-binding protein [Bremerella sp. JC817]|uniref:ABC transporter substrate-binding protein n=1 Tax=Bremerella sp. JC817 TaxID=3231756 RepID=UPI003459D93C